MSAELPLRPVIKPALRVLWRDASTVQFGIESRHAVVLGGVDDADKLVLSMLDGTRSVDDVVGDVCAAGGDGPGALRLLRTLLDAGVLDDHARPPAWRSEFDRQRLDPDMRALSLVDRSVGAAARAVDARADATVHVYGAGRVGAGVAALLAAAGVGRVACIDDAVTTGADVAPGGIDELTALPRGRAAAARVAALVPSARVDVRAGRPPTVAVVTAGAMPPPEAVVAVRDVVHVFALVRETTAIVGPFVIPGHSACWRCVHLARRDRDPAWPSLAAQLAGEPGSPEPVDVSLAAFAASLTAMQVLRWIDGARDGLPTIDGVVEFDLTGSGMRRRSVAAHGHCGCGAGEDQAVMAVALGAPA